MEYVELYAPTIVQHASKGALEDVRENTSHYNSAISHILHVDMEKCDALEHLSMVEAEGAIEYAASEYWDGPNPTPEPEPEVIPDFEDVSDGY